MMMKLTYSLFFLSIFLLDACTVQAQNFTIAKAKALEKAAWQKKVREIKAQIKPPQFPDRNFTIDKKEDFRNQLNQLILECSRTGGGKVIIKKGIYEVKGSIFLKSNVNLHLEKDVVLLFSPNPEDYLPVVKVRWEGTVCYNYSPLIYAYQAENIAITGQGMIDGQTEKFFHAWKQPQEADKKILRQMGNDRSPEAERIFGEGHFLRPDGIQFYECKHILLEDFSIKSSPFWTIHTVFCENILAQRLNVSAGTTNDDGFDPESCKNVWIKDCRFETHDDCIAIKAGRDQDAWDRPGTENILIQNCQLNTTVGSGFCIGSEMSGGVQDVFVENCIITSEKHGLNFKCNKDRGGFIKNVFVRNITITTAKYGLEFTNDYHSWRGNEYPTQFSDFFLSDFSIQQTSDFSIKIKGLEEKPIERIFLNRFTLPGQQKIPEIVGAREILNTKILINGKNWEFLK